MILNRMYFLFLRQLEICSDRWYIRSSCCYPFGYWIDLLHKQKLEVSMQLKKIISKLSCDPIPTLSSIVTTG